MRTEEVAEDDERDAECHDPAKGVVLVPRSCSSGGLELRDTAGTHHLYGF